MVKILPTIESPNYRVDDEGGVWTSYHPSTKIRETRQTWRRLSPHVDPKTGHLRVNLYVDREGKRTMIHRFVHTLVLEAFIGPRPPGMIARHFPERDPTNNRLSNLQWGTLQENMADKIPHGTALFGQRNGRAKLDLAKAREIRKVLARGVSQEKVATIFGVGQSTISRVHHRKVWPEAREEG